MQRHYLLIDNYYIPKRDFLNKKKQFEMIILLSIVQQNVRVMY